MFNDIKNINIKFSILFFLSIPLFAFFFGLQGLLYFYFFFLVTLLHECAHAIVGMRNGMEVKGIGFNFFGGATLINFKDLLDNNAGAIKTIAAGPIASILSSVLILIVFLFFNSQMILVLLILSVFIGVFNLLPIFPMDGGLLLFFALRRKFTDRVSSNILIASSFLCSFIGIALLLIFKQYWFALCFAVCIGLMAKFSFGFFERIKSEGIK